MVEPTVGMRVFFKGKNVTGVITDIREDMRVKWDNGETERFDLHWRSGSCWSTGHLHPIDEQPKPPEPGCFRVGDSVVVRGVVREFDSHKTLCPYLVALDNHTVSWFGHESLSLDAAGAPTEPGPAAHWVGQYAPPQAEAKRDTLPAPPHCPHCADNAGMLDAACERLGDREVELASALRAVDRLTAELRDYKGRARYRQ